VGRQTAGAMVPRMRWADLSAGEQMPPPRTSLIPSSSSSLGLARRFMIFATSAVYRSAGCHA
jgi:hypothetical protein